MEVIKSLKEISFEELFEAFSEAFIDYDIQVNKTELETMLNRRGFVPELSFGAFKDGKLISFTCNGIGTFNGIKTAYDTGTGTIKEHRGQGHATKIFTYSIPFLKKAGITQYLLEVLQHNTKAVSVYRNLGFKVSREFNYFQETKENIHFRENNTKDEYQVKPIDLSNTELLKTFHDFNPSWQNSFEAISRKPDDFKILGAYKEQKLLGYCISEPASGDITQIAVNKDYRRKGIGTQLMKESLKYNTKDSTKIINTETDCNTITSFIKSISIPQRGKQYEMIKQL